MAGSVLRVVPIQALPVLVHLRKDKTFAEINAGFGMSATTAWRYVEEIVTLLSARSPKLTRVLRKAKEDRPTHVILDGTLICTDGVRTDQPYISGKHRAHGMNVQVITGPNGTILWISGATPNGAHDLSTARVWGVLRKLQKVRILPLTDKGCRVPRPSSSSPRTKATTSRGPRNEFTDHTPSSADLVNA